LDIRVEWKWLRIVPGAGLDISVVELSSFATLVLVSPSCHYNSILFDSFMALKHAHLIREAV
jgi:hypothetical protein